jgi:hypothetical protein
VHPAKFVDRGTGVRGRRLLLGRVAGSFKLQLVLKVPRRLSLGLALDRELPQVLNRGLIGEAKGKRLLLSPMCAQMEIEPLCAVELAIPPSAQNALLGRVRARCEGSFLLLAALPRFAATRVNDAGSGEVVYSLRSIPVKKVFEHAR